MSRLPCCAVGYGGPFEIAASGLEPGTKRPWHITWLPKGYGPSHDDYVIALVAEPPGEDWSDYGLSEGTRPPLIQAVCDTIEKHMRERQP